MFPKMKIDESDILQCINETSESEISDILHSQRRLSFIDFVKLLSPYAQNQIELMREKAKELRIRNFGHVVKLYSPLYVSNYCINNCSYCGFRTSNQHEIRRRLSIDEAVAEATIIRNYGIQSLLLVSGEDPKAVSVDYFVELAKRLNGMFDYLSLEIQPMSENEYHQLVAAGYHGLTMYQETYQADLYKELHLGGPKKDYQRRLDLLEGAAKAGFFQIGIGALLGLSDWRIEACSLAGHGMWLMKHYWKSKINFSFPRITPIAGRFEIPHPVDEKSLEQLMLAFRIFFPENDIFISTREGPDFRMNLVQTAATYISGASKVSPGAYGDAENSSHSSLPQFSVNDSRTVCQLSQDLKSVGLAVVTKDWDQALS